MASAICALAGRVLRIVAPAPLWGLFRFLCPVGHLTDRLHYQCLASSPNSLGWTRESTGGGGSAVSSDASFNQNQFIGLRCSGLVSQSLCSLLPQRKTPMTCH